MIKNLSLLVCTLLLCLQVFAQPTSQNPKIKVQKLLTIPAQGVRVAIDKKTERMYFNTSHDGGPNINAIYEVLNYKTSPTYSKLADKDNHGITEQMTGMLIHNGIIYVSGSIDNGNSITGIIKKATLPITGGGTWTTVAKSAPYSKSNSAFDHRMNAIDVDPSGQYLYLNSGSKSDHGEENDGQRDVPLTTKIIRIPIASVNLRLANNDSLNPYVYARGTRNSFGLAFDAAGNFFGTENAGDRDHPEELNWLREGHHYGFPWRLGGVNNPQQFAEYSPGISNGQWFSNTSTDYFIQSNPVKSIGWVEGHFKTDPNFPQKPESLILTEPVINLGPNADMYRDTTDFTNASNSTIKDASVEGTKMTSFSPHLSPAGIIFDKVRYLSKDFKNDGFLVFCNSGGMASAFNSDNSGGALAQIKLTYDASSDNYKANTTNIVTGFNSPLGVELYKNDLYVIEHDGTSPGIYKVSFEESIEIPQAFGNIVVDGKADDTDWNFVDWSYIDKLWVDNVSGNENTMPSASDFSGRYKAVWKGSKLYVLTEITDNIFDGKLATDDPLTSYSDYDCVEILINQSNSKAMHERNNKAFAFHISAQGDALDLRGDGVTTWSPNPARVFNKFTPIVVTSITGTGTLRTWETAITVYDSTFNELLSETQNAASLVTLTSNKMIGISVSYNDRDGGPSRRFMIGSNVVAGTTNNARNIPWQDASAFGQAKLVGSIIIEPTFIITTYKVNFRSNRDSTINVTLINQTPNQQVTYSIVPTSVNFANISINGVSGAISIAYVANKVGSQIFTITGNNGFLTYSKTLNITITSISGVATIPSGFADKSIENRVEIYPNPASSKVTINHISGIKTLKLVDLQGSVKSEWTIANADKTELNLDAIPKGFYLLYFSTENYTFIKKLIIQ